MAGIGDIAKEAGVKYEDTSAVINALRELIKKGEKITLQDFGTFSIDVQAERKGRNPSTGDVVVTPAKSVPKFKFNYGFKDKVAEAIPVDQEKLQKKLDYKEKVTSKQAGKKGGKKK